MTAMGMMTEAAVAPAVEPTTERAGGRFWCHECNAQVPTSLDEASAEVCCNNCGGNFVEEIDEVNDAQYAARMEWDMQLMLECVYVRCASRTIRQWMTRVRTQRQQW